jgi:hypothetical protein
MKRNLRNLVLALLTALTLVVGYAVAQQQTTPQPAQQTQGDTDQETNDDQAGTEQEGEHEDGAEAGEQEETGMDDESGESANAESAEGAESEELEGPEASQVPSAIESFGSVALVDAVKTAQTTLGSSSAPFEATLEQVNGQLVWMLDFVSPAKQVMISAESGKVTATTDLSSVPSADASLTDYGSLSLDKVVEVAQGAYGSPADVTELALEKDTKTGVLTWRVDIGDKLAVIDANTGGVIALEPLKN